MLRAHDCVPSPCMQLSGGAIAGIVVGSVVGFVGVLAAMLLLRQRLAPPVDCSEGGSKAKLALLQLAPKRTFAPGNPVASLPLLAEPADCIMRIMACNWLCATTYPQGQGLTCCHLRSHLPALTWKVGSQFIHLLWVQSQLVLRPHTFFQCGLRLFYLGRFTGRHLPSCC